jgi:hypothetical protein
MSQHRRVSLRLCALLATAAASCQGAVSGGRPPGRDASYGDVHVSSVVVTVSPPSSTIAAGDTQSFTASVTGADNTGVTWDASGGTITAGGVFTAPAIGGAYIIHASSVADPLSSGTALVNVTGGGASIVEPFYSDTEPYVKIMTPMPFATYFAPATIRIWAHAPDYDTDNVNNYSPQVDFYMGTTMVGSAVATADGYRDYYQVDVANVPAGSYELYARSLLASGTVESIHIPVTVVDVGPHAGPTMDLTSDLVLSGGTSLDVVGTPTARALITSGNGSRIRSAANWTGHLTIQNADVIGLGSMDVTGIEVTAAGTNAITITDSVFDRCGPLALTANDQAPVTIRGNTLQPNMLTPVNAEANYRGSHPSLTIAGGSSAAKVFQGNNVGVSFVRFDRSSHWMIGGDNDAAGNIFIGVRAGMEVNGATDVTIRGNFSYHRYPFGWSEGLNLFFDGTGGPALVEHNMFRGSSWMIQSLSGEFRYNLLVDNVNHAFFRFTAAGTSVHHNILVNVGYQRFFEPSGGLRAFMGSFDNNTVDVGGQQLGWFDSSFMIDATTLTSGRNNVFTGFAFRNPYNIFTAGTTTNADYNCFFNPDTTMSVNYADRGLGAHDCGGAAGADPKFAQARIVPFPIGDGDIWLRRVTVSQILALYRSVYTPAAGSPLIDAGSPSDDTGGMRNTDIGAIGAGNPHPADQFGRFGQ